jgi:hypothetical protein
MKLLYNEKKETNQREGVELINKSKLFLLKYFFFKYEKFNS